MSESYWDLIARDSAVATYRRVADAATKAGKPMRIKHLLRRWRSAVTGRFVTKRYAKRHPKTTVQETED